MSSPPPESSPISPLFAGLWRRSRPSHEEVARAYARFQRRARPRRRAAVRDVVAWVGAGMLAGMGSLYAATAAHERWHGAEPVATASASHAPVAPAKLRSSPTRIPESERGATSKPAEHPEPSSSTLPKPDNPSAQSWQQAARGLRESDFDAVDEALRKLSRQGAREERAIAKLVRAQVLLRQQRAAEAKLLLLELANDAESPIEQKKSALLLEQWWPVASSHRSFASDAGTDSP